MKAYLSGAMEYSPDSGQDWRASIETFLRQELGHDVYNPVRDSRKNLTDEEVRLFRSWKRTDRPRFLAVIRKIIQYDLDRLEDGTDYVICYWDQWCAKGGGTHGELTTAFHRRLPVYLVTGVPFEEISAWILGCCSRMFANFDELKEFLRRQAIENDLKER